MGQLTLAAALMGSGAVGLSLGLVAPHFLRWLFPRRSSALSMLPIDSSSESHKEKLPRDPRWEPPQKQPAPFPQDDIITFDPLTIEPGAIYPLMISAVVPRPIAFISTLSKDGIGNLSPYSYFNVLSHDPPVLAMGHCWSKGKPKDSLRNILDTKEMVVCLISEWFVESANHTCGPYDPSVNEMELAGLTPVPSDRVAPPRIAESAVNFECKLLHHYDLKDKAGQITNTVVLAEIVLIHIAKGVTMKTPNSGKTVVDPVKLQPVCRLGGNTYGATLHLFDIPRPDKEGRYPWSSDFVSSERDRMLGNK